MNLMVGSEKKMENRDGFWMRVLFIRVREWEDDGGG